MKTLSIFLLATFASASFAHAADNATSLRDANKKAAADYKSAKANCKSLKANAEDVCIEEAKVARARAETDAMTQFDNTLQARTKVRAKQVDAEFALAKERCDDKSGADKDSCRTSARSTHTAALADVKADRAIAATTADEQQRTAATLPAPSTTDKARDAMGTVADKTERAADKTGAAVADSMITTKVKADIFKEPELKSMAIHVETDKGVVMLSGFVDSKADAEKAVRVARGVSGVTDVKSSIKVK